LQPGIDKEKIMLKKILLSKFNGIAAIALLLTTFVCLAQTTKPAGPKFDTADFAVKAELADWLVRYDMVAWKTTDVVVTEDKAEIAKMGTEWFCFEDEKGLWHAVYGKYADGRYDVVFHYTMDTSGKITKIVSKIDQGFLDTHAKSLVTAKKQLETKLPANAPRFNQYIRRNPDKTFDVWMFPAFQSNGVAVYGGEGVYKIDATGGKIVADTSYFQDNFRGFKSAPPREIWLNYTEIEKPTLGSVFFVWYYKEYFTKIFIDNSKSTSTAVKTGNGYLWVNVEKDETKDTKPK